jgi:predicted anti-sigma-YlaC factor YlaD
MKNCRKTLNILSEYLDGYLSNSEKTLVKQHLLECNRCRNEFDKFKIVKSALRDSLKYQTLPHFQPVLYSKIRERNSWRRSSLFNFRLPVYVGSATIIILLSFIFFKGPMNTFENKSIKPFTDENSVVRTNQTIPQNGPSLFSQGPNTLVTNKKPVSPILAQQNQNDIIYF